MQILHITEKPSVARTLTSLLSKHTTTTHPCKYITNHFFKHHNHSFVVTSVLGHLCKVDFDDNRKWIEFEPFELFSKTICLSVEEKVKPVAKNIQTLVNRSAIVVVWTDCDREGEYIANEIAIVSGCRVGKQNGTESLDDVVIRATTNNNRIVNENIQGTSNNFKNTMDNINNSKVIIKRARFNALSYQTVISALNNLNEINMDEVNAVATRIELDLRIGSAFTRMQTLSLSSVGVQGVVSYGSCQIPTLGFVVERDNAIKQFVPENHYSIVVNIAKPKAVKTELQDKLKFGGNIKTIQKSTNLIIDEFTWNRNCIYDYNCVYFIYRSLENEKAVVVDKKEISRTKMRPLPLRTVEMQKKCCSILKMGGKKLMEVAESLYNKGYISYPRTETDSFPPNFDHFATISAVKSDVILNGIFFKGRTEDIEKNLDIKLTGIRINNPRKGNNNDMAHLPIYPIKGGSGLTGHDRSVYEFILRRYVACLMDNAKGIETNVTIKVGDEEFSRSGLKVTESNYLKIYVYEKWNDVEINHYEVGETFELERIDFKTDRNENLHSKKSTIKINEGFSAPPTHLTEAELITLMDKNGIGTDATIHEHIQKIIDRSYAQKTGDKIYPLSLGTSLIKSYTLFDASLCKPLLRAELEMQLKQIEKGEAQSKVVLKAQLKVYSDIYTKIVSEKDKFLSPFVDSMNNGDNKGEGGDFNGNKIKRTFNNKRTIQEDNYVENVNRIVTADNYNVSNYSTIQCMNFKQNDNINNGEIWDNIINNYNTGNSNKENIRQKESNRPDRIIKCNTKNSKELKRNNNIIKTTPTNIKKTVSTNVTEKETIPLNEQANNIKCKCNKNAKLFIVQKQTENNGRKFYSCEQRRCDIFVWEEEAQMYKPLIMPESDVKCHCGFDTKIMTAHSKDNYGKLYYRCNKSHKPCNFFMWKE